ncbi:MAG: DUF1707 SHOCT-like domain-containing protein [Longimicrobiales bacterium]
MTDKPEHPANAAARTNTIDLLSEHFAQDHLSLEDFERRVGKVHRAETLEALQALLKGLPTGNVPATLDDTRGTSLAPPIGASVPAARVKESDRAVAVFSETKRLGRWIPARENQIVAALGSVVLDLREAMLGPGVTTFKCLTFLGSVEVIVPEGLYVECGGSAVLGSFEHHDHSPASLDPAGPVVRIEGMAVLGSVEVQVREVGESKRDARRRRRREKKERKRLGSGR